jgi:hypothetical protein
MYRAFVMSYNGAISFGNRRGVEVWRPGDKHPLQLYFILFDSNARCVYYSITRRRRRFLFLHLDLIY